MALHLRLLLLRRYVRHARGVISQSVAINIRVEMPSLRSAQEMWDYIRGNYSLVMPGPMSHLRRCVLSINENEPFVSFSTTYRLGGAYGEAPRSICVACS